MEEEKTYQGETDGLKVLLNPAYYEKLKKQESIDRYMELTDEEKAEFDK